VSFRPSPYLAVIAAALGLLVTPWLVASVQPAPLPLPEDPAQARVELGRRLFFDPILSSDRTISCASCHKPEFAFADNLPVSLGVQGRAGTRNTPTVMNTAARTSMFWDGRAETLEEQAIFPIENPLEMDLPIADALKRLNDDPHYAQAFAQTYGGPATARTLGRALAAYQKSLDTVQSPYDRYALGDDAAISESAKRGRLLFIGKGKCADCHSGEDFTSDRFRNIGLYNGRDLDDRGRGAVTGRELDDGQFKVPSLRNVAVTAPYMHNGMFATLREVISYYDNPYRHVPDARGRDAAMPASLGLSAQEIDDLEQFLLTLTDDRFRTAQAQAVPR
jgi:cytochrome c peroxidase